MVQDRFACSILDLCATAHKRSLRVDDAMTMVASELPLGASVMVPAAQLWTLFLPDSGVE